MSLVSKIVGSLPTAVALATAVAGVAATLDTVGGQATTPVIHVTLHSHEKFEVVATVVRVG